MINITTLNMPNCFYNRAGVSEAQRHFDHWLSQFDIIGSSCPSIDKYVSDHHSKLVNLNIEFSNDTPVKPYGYLSVDDIKEKIKKKWGWSEELEKIFRDSFGNWDDVKGMMQEMKQSIVGAICRMRGLLDTNAVKDIIDGWIREMLFLSRIVGCYDDSKQRIIFYVNHIGNDLLEYESVFIHELFHAFHFNHAKRKSPSSHCDIVRRNDYTTETVIESLASYYENHYCKRHSIPTSLKHIWNVNKPEIYPYSGAKYIDDSDFSHFIEILTASTVDMDAALRILLMDEIGIFYNIKNDKTPTTRKISDVVSEYKSYLSAFKKHLIAKGIDTSAAKSYVSYIASAFKKCWGIADSVLVCLNYASQLHLSRSLKAQLLASPPKEPETTVNNWKTALGHLIDFIYTKKDDLTGDINIAVKDVKSQDLALLEEFAKLYRGGTRTFKSTEILDEVFAISGRRLTCIVADFAAPDGNREHVFYRSGFDKYQIL